MFISPTAALLEIGAKTLIEKYSKNTKTSLASEFQDSAIKAEIESRVLLASAKVEQEMAISRRIDSAEEVEIEEFYDTTGKGNLGLKAGEDSFGLGLSGEGRKITKRIIKFKGCSPITNNT